MLGLGWSEMLVIGIVVLIVVGPKDLPVMMRNLGRMMGTVRRMSNEFRREIDKAIAVDEIREAKKAISDPLKQTSQDISREFNTIRDGKVEPSGKLAPSEAGKESVVDEIHAQAGMAKAEPSAAAMALRAKVSETVAKPANAATTTAEQPAEAAKPKVKAAPRNGGTSTAKTKAAVKPKSAKATTKATAAKGADSKPAAKPASKKAATKKTTPARAKSAADAGSEG